MIRSVRHFELRHERSLSKDGSRNSSLARIRNLPQHVGFAAPCEPTQSYFGAIFRFFRTRLLIMRKTTMLSLRSTLLQLLIKYSRGKEKKYGESRKEGMKEKERKAGEDDGKTIRREEEKKSKEKGEEEKKKQERKKRT